MDRMRQHAIVQIAVNQGLITSEDVAGVSDEAPLRALVDAGTLSEDDVRRLEQILASAPTMPPQRNLVPRKRSVSADTPTEMWDDSAAELWEDQADRLGAAPDATPTLPPVPGGGLASTDDLIDVSATHSLHAGTAFGRYTILKFLGAGGMGQVYKAYDSTLDRHIALKFLKGAEPDQVQRFFREARAQARLAHENICNVFEAGEIEGRPYIAMQYIKGEELADLAGRVGLDQRIKILRLVCDAVHAAHREGMIHRDLKPGNVMIEPLEDGRYKPYVMDFGLVRDERDPGATASGALLGTPAYISPEQAMGEADRIDRRTDVYSLGATLYFLLAGRPPFDVDNPLVHLVKVIDEDPLPPQQRDPGIPADLDTIAMKCLEKSPQARYASARALGEELQRYLDGDPIEARPISGLQRLIKKARKNKTIVVITAVAAVLVLAALGTAGGMRLRAVQQARLAQQFGEDTRQVEWTMRAAHLVPIHDLSEDVSSVREHMAAIEDRMGDPIARGAGHYALGRGYLALGDAQRAGDELQAAWDGGYQDPDVAYALGLAMTQQYQLELAALPSIADPDTRAARRIEVREEFLGPSVRYLSASEGSELASPAYVLGLVALVEDRYEDGLAHARVALDDSAAWFYEPRVLEGDLYREWGVARSEAGDRVGALERFEKARRAYAEAAQVAPSDPTVRAAISVAWNATLMELYWGDEDLEPVLDELQRATEDALAVDPRQGLVLSRLAYAHWNLAVHDSDHGRDPRRRLATAAVLSARAARATRSEPFAYVLHGMVMNAAADFEAERGRDPRSLQDTALKSLALAIRLDPDDAIARVKSGDVYRWRGWYEWDQEMDPLPSWERAEAFFLEGIERDPEEATYHSDLANLYIDRGQYLDTQDQDPFPSLDRGIASLDRAVELDPNEAYTSASLGNAYSARGAMLLDRGRDPTESLDLAAHRFEEAVRLAPTWSLAHGELAWCHYLRAKHDLQSGRDPGPSLDRTERHLDDAARHNPGSMDVLHYRARARILSAQWEMGRGGDPVGLVAEANDLLDRAVRLDPSNKDLLAARNELSELVDGASKAAPPVGEDRRP